MNNLRIIFSFLLPLITFPYTSRVLDPKMFERVDYAILIVAYFILFATLGIVKFRIRTITGVRYYKEMLSIAVAELLLILKVSTIIISIIYSFAFFSFSKCFFDKILYIFLGSNIILSTFNFEWFYACKSCNSSL